MKVAVFGAAGWLGRAVLENFAGKHEVRAFELNPEAWDVSGTWTARKFTEISPIFTPLTKPSKAWTARST